MFLGDELEEVRRFTEEAIVALLRRQCELFTLALCAARRRRRQESPRPPLQLPVLLHQSFEAGMVDGEDLTVRQCFEVVGGGLLQKERAGYPGIVKGVRERNGDVTTIGCQKVDPLRPFENERERPLRGALSSENVSAMHRSSSPRTPDLGPDVVRHLDEPLERDSKLREGVVKVSHRFSAPIREAR